MEFIPTRLPEVVLIKPKVFGDERGFFLESWQQKKFADAGIHADFVQDNHSHSSQWVLRGMHYQIQNTQGKLVRVSRGAVYDVAIDVRRSSPRFGEWVGVELSDANHHMMWIPPGFAHGFLTLTEKVDFMYKCTELFTRWQIADRSRHTSSAPDARRAFVAILMCVNLMPAALLWKFE